MVFVGSVWRDLFRDFSEQKMWQNACVKGCPKAIFSCEKNKIGVERICFFTESHVIWVKSDNKINPQPLVYICLIFSVGCL